MRGRYDTKLLHSICVFFLYLVSKLAANFNVLILASFFFCKCHEKIEVEVFFLERSKIYTQASRHVVPSRLTHDTL